MLSVNSTREQVQERMKESQQNKQTLSASMFSGGLRDSWIYNSTPFRNCQMEKAYIFKYSQFFTAAQTQRQLHSLHTKELILAPRVYPSLSSQCHQNIVFLFLLFVCQALSSMSSHMPGNLLRPGNVNLSGVFGPSLHIEYHHSLPPHIDAVAAKVTLQLGNEADSKSATLCLSQVIVGTEAWH